MNETPIDMILFCPLCYYQHVDEPKGEWKNPPHRSHSCKQCGWVWRPADVPTNGVKEIKTQGQHDSAMLSEELPDCDFLDRVEKGPKHDDQLSSRIINP